MDAHRRWQSVQPYDLGDGRRAWAPQAPEPEDETADRRERMAIDRADIESANRLGGIGARRARYVAFGPDHGVSEAQ